MIEPTYITRTDLCAAIGKGIAAYPALTEPERDALRQVAVSAKVVGAGYSNGCPWSQAFGYEYGIIGNIDGRYPNNFAFAYDDEIQRSIAFDPSIGYDQIAVIG